MKNLLSLMFLLLTFESCTKMEMAEPTNEEVFYVCEIMGIVPPDYGGIGAIVSFNGVTTQTDQRGIYRFNEVKVVAVALTPLMVLTDKEINILIPFCQIL